MKTFTVTSIFFVKKCGLFVVLGDATIFNEVSRDSL